MAVGLTLLVVQPGLSSPLLPTAVMPSAQRLPLQQQPFYPELLAKRQHWLNAPIGRVVGDSPRETLLNFYAVTANASALINELIQNHLHDPGLNWSSSVQEQITEIETLVLEARKALDLSAIPESRRADVGTALTLKLKVILDYLLSSQAQQLSLPDQQAIQDGASQRALLNGEWSVGGTTVILTPSGKSRIGNYRFSAETVKEIPKIYKDILPFRPSASEWFTPNLYSDFARTPDRIVPQKWYLMLPQKVRTNLLELSIDSNTVLQLSMTLFVILIYGLMVWMLVKSYFKTYYDATSFVSKGDTVDPWNQDQLSWRRLLILLPLLPLSIAARWLINIEINITGNLATILQPSFEILISLTLALLGCLLLDASGHSISELVLRFRGREQTLIRLRRAKSFVMPLCRAGAVVFVLAIVYQLLLNLGIPSATVLTFSAVPGLAIGLGASKLLANFFAGLSIQSDRPLKLGEFCQVGAHQGFITRIGLRSLQIETLDSIVTIPNSVVDEQMVMNYSVRSNDSYSPARQKLDIRYQVKESLGAFATRELLGRVPLRGVNPEARMP
ncbi:mechanosensitive ion channel domain-containing protein [Synechococcus sp. BA-124 BA4]|nr:mechanosensitive ion channel domain-containing protein [Synechococcus sp. BA-124 BA4]